MFTLTLSEPKELIITPAVAEQRITISEIKILAITDDCTSAVVARVIRNGVEVELVLWEGEAYTAIGNWTQEQANSRIIELL